MQASTICQGGGAHALLAHPILMHLSDPHSPPSPDTPGMGRRGFRRLPAVETPCPDHSLTFCAPQFLIAHTSVLTDIQTHPPVLVQQVGAWAVPAWDGAPGRCSGYSGMLLALVAAFGVWSWAGWEGPTSSVVPEPASYIHTHIHTNRYISTATPMPHTCTHTHKQ